MATQPTIENLDDVRYSDLVLWEEVTGGYSYDSRDIVSVTATTGGTFPLGSVIFRPKATAASATWDLVDATGDIAYTNDYALVIGDDFEPTEKVTFVTATPRNAIAISRRARIKASKLLESLTAHYAGVTATNFADLQRALASQGILVVDSLTAIPA